MGATDYSRNGELLARYAAGDESALGELLTLNAGLITSIALRFRERAAEGHCAEMDDLMQLGAIGMLKAIRSYDPAFGTAFSTYAVPLVIGEIKRFLRDDGPVKGSRITTRLGAEAMHAREDFVRREGREPSVDELARILGVTREELANAVASGRPPHSFSEPVGDDGASLGELLSGEDEYEGLCDRLALREAIRSLPPLHRQIVTLRYFRDLSQQQTADILGLTQVKISREEKKIMASLREKCS